MTISNATDRYLWSKYGLLYRCSRKYPTYRMGVNFFFVWMKAKRRAPYRPWRSSFKRLGGKNEGLAMGFKLLSTLFDLRVSRKLCLFTGSHWLFRFNFSRSFHGSQKLPEWLLVASSMQWKGHVLILPLCLSDIRLLGVLLPDSSIPTCISSCAHHSHLGCSCNDNSEKDYWALG